MLQHPFIVAALAEQRQADLCSQAPPRRHVDRWPWRTVLWARLRLVRLPPAAAASAAPPIEGRR
jgi:hypothetical protein